KRGQLRDFVKERFGIEMDLDHVSAARVAALRKLAAEEPPAVREQVTKKEAVRRALATLGKNAKIAEIQGHIKQAFGIDMSAGHISTTRGEIRREGKKDKAAKPAKAAVPEVAPETALPARPPILLEDILTLRGLVERVGVEQLRTLLDVVARPAQA